MTHAQNPHAERARVAAIAALAALLVLDLAMFAAMLAGVPPHPPGERGPFIAASAALALASLLMLALRQPAGAALALFTALAFLPAVGPHKFFTEAAARELAPLIVVGSASVIALAGAALRLLRASVSRRAAGPSKAA